MGELAWMSSWLQGRQQVCGCGGKPPRVRASAACAAARAAAAAAAPPAAPPSRGGLSARCRSSRS
jgi:hypothetical protein